MTTPVPRQRVAIVGAGAAGLTAAHLLDQDHDVVLFERAARVGGHVNTVMIDDGPDAGTAVDTGFIVYNERNYPNFCALLADLGVATRTSNMSFGYFSETTGLQYAGTGLDGLFAQRQNLVDPRFWQLIAGILLFARRARKQMGTPSGLGTTYGEFLDRGLFGDAVARDYALPMAAAIWSASQEQIREFPAESIFRFFANHGLLAVRDRIEWRTIVGGSRTYVDALLARFSGTVRTSAKIAGIARTPDNIVIHFADGPAQQYDLVVIATHADEALALLDEPSEHERRLLGAWDYSRSTAVLHTDASVLPPNRRAWASWNYRRTSDSSSTSPVYVSYHMNLLQGLETEADYVVTLNPPHQIPASKVVAEFEYTHPCYDRKALATQHELRQIGGRNRTFFCGSYLGYGFHEDAVRSSFHVADQLRVER